MPYIEQHLRTDLNGPISDLADEILKCLQSDQYRHATSALVNYVACKLYKDLMIRGYFANAQFISGLDMAKMEIYRRWTGPYEDRKIEDNGDI